jgi:hypothetical protein
MPANERALTLFQGKQEMNSKLTHPGPASAPTAIPVLLNPKEAAEKCRCSESFLAKKRMTGDGQGEIRLVDQRHFRPELISSLLRSRYVLI